MTSRDFAYFLQGFLELRDKSVPITQEQTDCIQRHLNMVFKHEIDPSYGDKQHQEELNKIHKSGWSAGPPFDPDKTLIRC